MKNKKNITISRNIIDKEGGIVILSVGEYKRLCEKAVPTYYLEGEDAEKLDKLVEEGFSAYRRGKTKKIDSLSELD